MRLVTLAKMIKWVVTTCKLYTPEKKNPVAIIHGSSKLQIISTLSLSQFTVETSWSGRVSEIEENPCHINVKVSTIPHHSFNGHIGHRGVVSSFSHGEPCCV